MRYALVDNATLTSVQRLMGEIEVKNVSVVENDLLAFENYLQAILFYDSIISIDDYKEYFRASRQTFFSNIRFIPKNYFDYNQFVDQAYTLTDDIVLEIKAGKITDKDFSAYLKKLQMTFQFTWDLSASNYYLTQKMLLSNTNTLSHESFNILHTMLMGQKNEQLILDSIYRNKTPKLYNSDGKEIILDIETGKTSGGNSGEGVSGVFLSLIASLNWISQRTAFYTITADYLYADLILQPIRQAFLENIIKRCYPSYNTGVFTGLRNNINQMSLATIQNTLTNSGNFSFVSEVPLFSVYFANKTKDPKLIIEAAMNERESKSFIQARTKLRMMNSILIDGDRAKFHKDINTIVEELKSDFILIQSKYGLGKPGFKLSQLKFLFSWIPLVKDIKIPSELDPRIKELEFMKHLVPRKGLNAVYRNVVEDLIQFENLGSYKDILTSKVRYADDVSQWKIRTENEEYINAFTPWKRPMY